MCDDIVKVAVVATTTLGILGQYLVCYWGPNWASITIVMSIYNLVHYTHKHNRPYEYLLS